MPVDPAGVWRTTGSGGYRAICTGFRKLPGDRRDNRRVNSDAWTAVPRHQFANSLELPHGVPRRPKSHTPSRRGTSFHRRRNSVAPAVTPRATILHTARGLGCGWGAGSPTRHHGGVKAIN
jgi:hypothetical protein